MRKLSNFSTILWDFDGVIFDGMRIKSEGFRELLSPYGTKEDIERFMEFHFLHGGVPRFQKIEYFFKNILKRDISLDDINILAKRFAKIIEKNVFDRKNLIEDTLKFIEQNYKNYNFHITSGAEHSELNAICGYFGISKYFISIEGSPPTKDIVIARLLKEYNYRADEVVLVGDSFTDYEASRSNGIHFLGYNNPELRGYGDGYIERFLD
ncbi:MAG: HAD family hydrolase [Epsilonproteobacteria bacterium]|nr:HAD family hydrolase [Campylobacterota bacterium]